MKKIKVTREICGMLLDLNDFFRDLSPESLLKQILKNKNKTKIKLFIRGAIFWGLMLQCRITDKKTRDELLEAMDLKMSDTQNSRNIKELMLFERESISLNYREVGAPTTHLQPIKPNLKVIYESNDEKITNSNIKEILVDSTILKSLCLTYTRKKMEFVLYLLNNEKEAREYFEFLNYEISKAYTLFFRFAQKNSKIMMVEKDSKEILLNEQLSVRLSSIFNYDFMKEDLQGLNQELIDKELGHLEELDTDQLLDKTIDNMIKGEVI